MKLYVLDDQPRRHLPRAERLRDVRHRGRGRGAAGIVAVIGVAVACWLARVPDAALRSAPRSAAVVAAVEPSPASAIRETAPMADIPAGAEQTPPIVRSSDPRSPPAAESPRIPGLPLLAATRAAPDGWAIAGVRAESLMARMGLQEGDVIMSIDGRLVAGRTDIPSLLAPAMLGTPTPAYVLREGQTVLISLVLPKRQAVEPPASSR